MQLTHPDPGCETFARVPIQEREEINRWLRAFANADFSAGVGKGISWIARMMGVDEVTTRRKYDALRKNDGHWTAVADGRRIRNHISKDGVTANLEFRTFLTTLAERHQRNSRAAYRKFVFAWSNREPIPGIEGHPGWPSVPFSYRTFVRILAQETDRRKYKSIRVGTTSKTNSDLAQVFTTRVGLYPGAVLQVDDVWHDHMVMLGNDPRPRRVMELGILDLFSGCRPHWGCMPRIEKPEGGMRNIRGPEMRQFIAGWLWNFGTHPAGTRMMLEHGTAALPSDIIALLSDHCTCSGERYFAVPIMMSALDRSVPSSSLAFRGLEMPKSVSSTSPPSITRMFPGLMSR
jgi:hypothetical protein